MAKYYASEICNEVAGKAVQIHGGYGYIKDYRVERLYRDCRVFTIYDRDFQTRLLQLGGREGSFPGMLKERIFCVEVIDPEHPVPFNPDGEGAICISYDGNPYTIGI